MISSNKYLKTIAVSTCFLASLAGNSKTIDKYGVSVQVENLGGQLPEVALGLAGVTCTSSLSVAERETIRGKQGENDSHTFKSNGQMTLTMLGQPQSHTVVPVNPDNKDPKITVSIFENCSGSFPTPTMCTDPRSGKTYACVQRQTVSMPMSWSCEVPAANLPQGQNAKKSIQCNPPNDMAYWNAFSNNPMQALLMNYLHQKKITINTENLGREYHMEKYNCPDNLDMAHLDPNLTAVIRLSGGIKTGALATNKVDYKFSINGGHEQQKTRADGITNFDILYCKKNPGEPIELKLGATYGSKEVSDQRAVFDSNNPYGKRTLPYKVKGSLWGSVDSSVEAQIVSGSAK